MSKESEIEEVINDCVPLFKRLAVGRYAISIGGSRGKGTTHLNSDVDFRLFCDDVLPDPVEKKNVWNSIQEAINKWKDKGIDIDGCWVRKISDIDQGIDSWFDGKGQRVDRVWTIWGYQLLADLYYEQIVEDPHQVMAEWKLRLDQYPSKLKKTILDRHMAPLKYWRDDYHYGKKVDREDVVFLSSLSTKIIHDMIQVIFAINETYYIGDGSNLEFIRKFPHQPPHFEERVTSALYPADNDAKLKIQRDILIQLINDTEKLVESFQTPSN